VCLPKAENFYLVLETDGGRFGSAVGVSSTCSCSAAQERLCRCLWSVASHPSNWLLGFIVMKKQIQKLSAKILV